jgi:hypothetical protein
MVRITLFVTAVAIAFAGCGSDDDESETTAPAGESATTTAAEDASPLEGTWRTEPVTVAEMADTLRETGLGEFIDDFEKNAPISDAPTTLILEIKGDWDLTGQTEEGKTTDIDYDAEYKVDGDDVEVIHSEGSNSFRWSVNGDVLNLTWLETTFGKGVPPEEAFQRALYMTADFHRAS